MIVDVKRTKIKKEECNRIKSHLIYEPHRRQSVDNLKFAEDGIFSKKIFGNIHKCECGDYIDRYDEICPRCGTRIIDSKNMPDFYIDLGVIVPVTLADYDSLWMGKRNKNSIFPDVAEKIMNYDSFIWIDENKLKSNNNYTEKDAAIIEDFNPDDAEEKFNGKKIYYGVEALKILGASDEWIEENTVDFLEISHPMYRPLVAENMSIPFITGINSMYSNIIKKINDVLTMKDIAKDRPFFMMIESKAILNLYNQIIDELFKEIQDVKYSIVKSEIISHPISGAIRAVLINRHDINEDVMLIGDTLVETLWPYLYKQCEGNMVKINKELVDKNYLVLVNRPPTINHLSIIAMKPRIASLYPFGHTEGTDNCLKHNVKYAEILKRKHKVGKMSRHNLIDQKLLDSERMINFGDVEKFGQGFSEDVKNYNCQNMNWIDNEKINNEKRSGEKNIKIGEEFGCKSSNNLEINDSTVYNERSEKTSNGSCEDVHYESEDYYDGIDTIGLRCIAMNPISMDGLAADTDGDCLLVIALYSDSANKEAYDYMLPSSSYMNYANSTIRNHIIEDFFFTQDNK